MKLYIGTDYEDRELVYDFRAYPDWEYTIIYQLYATGVSKAYFNTLDVL